MALFLVVDIEQKSQQRGTFGQNRRRNRIRTTWYLRAFPTTRVQQTGVKIDPHPPTHRPYAGIFVQMVIET